MIDGTVKTKQSNLFPQTYSYFFVQIETHHNKNQPNFSAAYRSCNSYFKCSTHLNICVNFEDLQMKNVDIMTILHNENNHEKMNKLEEIEIPKVAASQNILNDTINGRNDPLYKILSSVDN